MTLLLQDICRDSKGSLGQDEETTEKRLTTSPRNDAVRMMIAPSGKRKANAKPIMVPCAVTALWRSGLTFAHAGFAGQAISNANDKRFED